LGKLCAVVCISVLSGLLLHAQTPDTAEIHGTVVDRTGMAVAGADVALHNEQIGLERKARTDANGAFSFGGLPIAGIWRVTVVKQGFTGAALNALTLAAGTSSKLAVQLDVNGGQTDIYVTGSAWDLRTDQPQLGDLLTSEQAERVPLYGRKITYLPLLNAANRPAINQGDIFMNQNLFTTNGTGRRQTWFEVDGTTASDSWGRQTIFTNVPLMAVDEISVLTNGFSPAYGATAGSVLNIVTKSGGNHYHGQVLELWRPEGPEAKLSGFSQGNATSGNEVTSDTLGQSAAALGGPIGAADRLHFFLAGEYSRQDRASPVTSPLAAGSFVGHYRDWMGLSRLDYQLNQTNNAFLRMNVDGFYDTNPNGIVGGSSLPSVARTFRRKTYSLALGETAVLSPSVLNDARIQFQLASPITEFDPVEFSTQYVVPIGLSCGSVACGNFTSGTSQSALLLNRQYQVSDTLSLQLHRHQLRFGGSVIYAHSGGNSKEFGGPIYLGSFTYNPCSVSIAYCESEAYLGNINNVQTYQQSYGNADYTVDDTLWALFVQDDYSVTKRLTLNLGLRYEQQTFTNSRLDFAPRVGIVYDLTGAGQTILHASFGIYDSQIVDNSEANYALTGPTGVFNYTAAPGQPGFPATVASAPLPAFPPGAQAPLRSLYIRPGNSAYLNQFFRTSTLIGYPGKLFNPYSEQWTLGFEQHLARTWALKADYVGTRSLRIVRPLDVDAPSSYVRTAPNQTRSAQAANCTRPYWIYWYSQQNETCSATKASNPQPPYSVIQSDVNDGYAYYNALDLTVSRRYVNGSSLLASYTWSHTTDNVDPDLPTQNPNDPLQTGIKENGNAIFDQRNRFVLSGNAMLPLRIQVGGVATLAGGLPYNYVTGTTNSGDTGATTDRPVINGTVVGRNTGRGHPIYDIAPYIERSFPLLTERLNLDLRVEAFNALNHRNFIGYNGTYGNGSSPPSSFSAPLPGVTSQLPARSLQFSAKLTF
jgi:Carboxypeptidase regulatory-like domain